MDYVSVRLRQLGEVNVGSVKQEGQGQFLTDLTPRPSWSEIMWFHKMSHETVCETILLGKKNV